MTVFKILLTLFLWTETSRAAVAKQDELIDPKNVSLYSGDQDDEEKQDFKNVSHKAGEPLSEFEFFNAKLINISSSNRTSYKGGSDPLLKAASSGLFEGDMAGIKFLKNMSLGKNAILFNQRWPYGIIPYVIANTYDSAARTMIARAMVEFHLRTCVRFLPWTAPYKDYVFIFEGKGCWSHVGRVGNGAQLLSLEKPCLHFYAIVHELMHAVGFWHEQSRGDRDNYVTIDWNNIKKDMHYNFQKFNWNQIQHLNEAYDYTSIMHYSAYAFALNSTQPTIVPKEIDKLNIIGQSLNFSFTDIRKINSLYRCGDIMLIAPLVGTTSHCGDAHENCVEFAKRGECTINPSWMRPHCMDACGLCRKGVDCIDFIGPNCSVWAGNGECEINPLYMKTYCKKSCKICI